VQEVKMSQLGGFLALIGGAAVLVGHFVESLGSEYYLVLIGGIVAVVGGILSLRRRYDYLRS
jgi:hypothetical protein